MSFIVRSATEQEHKDLLNLFSQKSSKVYSMKHNPRGRAIIINMVNVGKLAPREGSTYDVTNLENLFRQLCFTVESYIDLTKSEIIGKLEVERKREDHKDSDAFILCIMSHGVEGIVYGKDQLPLNIDKDILELFNGERCPHLLNKPKIFIIQACQGKLATEGISTESADSDTPLTQATSVIPLDALKALRSGDASDSIHKFVHPQADMVVLYATVNGYEAYRNLFLGSWFIRSFVKVLSRHSYNNSLVELFNKVSEEVSNYRTNADKLMYGYKHHIQLPQINRLTFTKDFFFFPGYNYDAQAN